MDFLESENEITCCAGHSLHDFRVKKLDGARAISNLQFYWLLLRIAMQSERWWRKQENGLLLNSKMWLKVWLFLKFEKENIGKK